MPLQRPPGSRLTCRAHGLDALKIASVWEQGTTQALLCIISSPSYGQFSKLPAVFCEDFPSAIERNLLWEQTHPQGWFTQIPHVKTPMYVPSAPSLPSLRSVCSFCLLLCLWDRQQDYEQKKKQLWGFSWKVSESVALEQRKGPFDFWRRPGWRRCSKNLQPSCLTF